MVVINGTESILKAQMQAFFVKRIQMVRLSLITCKHRHIANFKSICFQAAVPCTLWIVDQSNKISVIGN